MMMTTTNNKLKQISDELRTNRPDLHQDRYGHFHFSSTNDGSQLRLKFQKSSVRLETRIDKHWVNLASSYAKDLSLTSDSKLKIGLFTV